MHFGASTHPHHPTQDESHTAPDENIDQLMSWGLDRSDADEWAAVELPVDDELVERVVGARRGGLSPAAYAHWCARRSWAPSDAEAFLRAGFSEPEARFTLTLLEHAASKRFGSVAALMEAWLDCPLSPAWICRALAIGITQPSSAQALFARSLNEPTLVRTIDINADFRGANNRDLTIDLAHLRTMGVQRLDPQHRAPTHPGRRETSAPRPHSSRVLWAVDDSAEPEEVDGSRG